ncbi:hypothetical protein Hanom_Chr02g00106331 [Helianthus anomalus]
MEEEKVLKSPMVGYNFVGLAIRPGEKECPYCIRKGFCKYGPIYRFNRRALGHVWVSFLKQLIDLLAF